MLNSLLVAVAEDIPFCVCVSFNACAARTMNCKFICKYMHEFTSTWIVPMACTYPFLLVQILNTTLIVIMFTPDSEKCKDWSKNNPTVVILVLLSSVAALTKKLSKIAQAPAIWQMLKDLQMEE